MCLTLGGKLFEPMNLGINNAVALRFSEKFPDADGGSENRLGLHIGVADSLVEGKCVFKYNLKQPGSLYCYLFAASGH